LPAGGGTPHPGSGHLGSRLHDRQAGLTLVDGEFMKVVAALAVVTCLACAQGAGDTVTGLSDASVAGAPDASIPDFASLPLPVFLRRQSFVTNTTEEVVDGNRNVWFRQTAVPPLGTEVFHDVGITDTTTVSFLAQNFALLPDPPVVCPIPTIRTLIRIDATGVMTTWMVCGSDDRGTAAPYANAFLAFPPIASF
jgi:hypothetical protein